VHEAEKLSLEQIQAFLNASQEIRFEGEAQKQIYHWIEQVLGRQEYHQQSRPARGLLRSYLTKMTGLSRAQVTRLIARYRRSGSLQPAPYRRHCFPQRYTRADVELLATVDAAHENLSGPATHRILEREYLQYGKLEYERLSTISVAHLYNLRQRPRYRERRLHYVKTRPTTVAIGERRCPDPQGQPGYLRVDTVHQGMQDGKAGPYHINSVDSVTQWEVLGCCPAISENFLIPVLEEMLAQCDLVVTYIRPGGMDSAWLDPLGEAAVHAIGYVSAINETDMKAIDTDEYAGTTLIGKLGVEAAYENQLHGKRGWPLATGHLWRSGAAKCGSGPRSNRFGRMFDWPCAS